MFKQSINESLKNFLTNISNLLFSEINQECRKIWPNLGNTNDERQALIKPLLTSFLV